MSQLNSKAGKEKEKFPSSFTFCCIQANSGLDDAHLHWRGQSTLNPPIQMLTSSGNTLNRHAQK